MRSWVTASRHRATALSEVINYGTIITGDGTVGASARMYHPGYGYAAQLVQNEEGAITTGDGAIGAQVLGHYSAGLLNQGEISVGAGFGRRRDVRGQRVLRYGDTTATVVEGALFATNGGIIETGDNSVGVRMNAVHEDVPYAGTAIVFDPPGCSYLQPALRRQLRRHCRVRPIPSAPPT